MSKGISMSFVIPCYRSEHTVEAVVDEIMLEAGKLNIENYEIVLVCDCSPDNVWSVIERLCREHNNIKGILFAKNFGQHAAMLAGYAASKGELLVSLDDDGQAPIDELGLLLKELEKGYDVVYAYYEEMKQTNFRKFGSWVATKMSEIMLGAPKDLKSSSFFVMKKYVADEIVKYENAYPYLAGLILRTTHNVSCVKTHHRERQYGTSGYDFFRLFKLWINGFTAFSVLPLRIGVLSGGFFSLFGLLFAITIVIRKILNPDISAGWASIIAVILVIGGLLLAMLGLVGEYVGRIYICINKSPQYVIKQRTSNGSTPSDGDRHLN